MSFKSKIQNRTSVIYSLSKETIHSFFEEKSFFHGAALSYYAIFSMFPLLYLVISLLGRYLGKDFILKMIEEFLKNNLGLKDVDEILNVVSTYNLDKGNLILEIIGFIVVLIASSAFLNSLRHSINEFYNVEITPLKGRKAIKLTILNRLLSLLLLATIACIFLIIYLFHSIGFTLIQSFFEKDTGIENVIIQLFNLSFSLLLNYILFLLIFKYLNNAKVPWNVASIGSIVTAVLLLIGQALIKFYLLYAFKLGSAGILGSIFILMTWVYYSSQIIFVGAKFSFTLAKKIGRPITKR